MLIVLGACIAAILVGAGLFYFGPEEFREIPAAEQEHAAVASAADVPMTPLAAGSSAVDAPERKNIAVYSEEGLSQVWAMAYGTDAPALPAVDFSKQYIIAVFAGTRPTGGYGISVSGIKEGDGVRTVAISVASPAEGCMVSQALTSPFELVAVPASNATLQSVEADTSIGC